MRILSKSTGNSEEVLEKAIARPKYFSPQSAIEFGIIDRVFLHFPILSRFPIETLESDPLSKVLADMKNASDDARKYFMQSVCNGMVRDFLGK